MWVASIANAGDGSSSGAARARSHFRSWEAADDTPPEGAGECSHRGQEDIAGTSRCCLT